MGNYSQLIFYGFCILLVNNIANTDATFFGLFGQASIAGTGTARIAPVPAAPAIPAAGVAGAAAPTAVQNALLDKLTQISAKLNQLVGGLAAGGTAGVGATFTPTAAPSPLGSAAEDTAGEDTAEEISPKIDDDAPTKKDNDGEPDYVVEEHMESDSDNEVKAVMKSSNGLQTRTGTNGRKVISVQSSNGYQLRNSITTSNSGRAASLGPQTTIVRVGSQPSYQNVQPTVQRTYYQNPQPVQRTYNEVSIQTQRRQPQGQSTYYQTQPAVQRTSVYYQNQAQVPQAGGYNYQSPGYQYRAVRYY